MIQEYFKNPLRLHYIFLHFIGSNVETGTKTSLLQTEALARLQCYDKGLKTQQSMLTMQTVYREVCE